MIGSVTISDQEIETVIPHILNKLKRCDGQTVEVPINLLIVLEHYITASRWYSDMNGGSLPYPSFENISGVMGRVIHDILMENSVLFKPRLGGEEYTIYKLLSECQSKNEVLELLKGVFEHV
ncbi:MAG: hypothetical protein RSC93_01380 [Erysipelotrichaceae bacterium]